MVWYSVIVGVLGFGCVSVIVVYWCLPMWVVLVFFMVCVVMLVLMGSRCCSFLGFVGVRVIVVIVLFSFLFVFWVTPLFLWSLFVVVFLLRGFMWLLIFVFVFSYSSFPGVGCL